MIKKLLIANRGEIACRIMRTAARMGIETVAVYSDADASALHVASADEAVRIGTGPASESYLRGETIIQAAHATGADAIHPGYGFLAENADFADAVRAAGLVFVGPSGDAMRALGGKSAAKEIAIKAGVPVVPGYQGADQAPSLLAREAARIGYPVMIKAVSGGGGRGMRRVDSADAFDDALQSARREASSAFGDDRMLVEKLVQRPRHIEVQVFGDSHGNAVHLFERDCSLQRRNQKVIEEAPAPGMSDGLRRKMTEAAVALARAVGYEGAGTVEFLVEGGVLAADAPWYFIEMNTRLQVEHPVTEEITGLDLVEWQLRVAAGEPLPLVQSAISFYGHAIEARVCAEDPANGFAPGIGRLAAFTQHLRGHDDCRMEQGFLAGDTISPFYDSLIAKLICHESSRNRTLALLVRNLEALHIAGPRVNTAFLVRLLQHPDVVTGAMDTGLIARDIDALSARRVTRAEIERAVAAFTPGAHAAVREDPAPWGARDAFQLGGSRIVRRSLRIDGRDESVDMEWTPGRELADVRLLGAPGIPEGPARSYTMVRDGATLHVLFEGEQVSVTPRVYDVESVADAGGGTLRAPITGRVAKVFVAEGDEVEAGGRIAVVEAMKMEHVLHAGIAGRLERLAVAEGQQVSEGALVAVIASAETDAAPADTSR